MRSLTSFCLLLTLGKPGRVLPGQQNEQAWLLEKYFPGFLRIPCFVFSFFYPLLKSNLDFKSSLFSHYFLSLFPPFTSFLLSQVAVIVSETTGPPAFNFLARLSLMPEKTLRKMTPWGVISIEKKERVLRAILDIAIFNESRVRRISKAKKKKDYRVKKKKNKSNEGKQNKTPLSWEWLFSSGLKTRSFVYVWVNPKVLILWGRYMTFLWPYVLCLMPKTILICTSFGFRRLVVSDPEERSVFTVVVLYWIDKSFPMRGRR